MRGERGEPSEMLGFVLIRGGEVSYGILVGGAAIDKYIALSYFLTRFSCQKKYGRKSAKKP